MAKNEGVVRGMRKGAEHILEISLALHDFEMPIIPHVSPKQRIIAGSFEKRKIFDRIRTTMK